MDNSDNTGFRVLAWVMFAFGIALAFITTSTALRAHGSFLHWFMGILLFSAPCILGCAAILYTLRRSKGRGYPRNPDLRRKLLWPLNPNVSKYQILGLAIFLAIFLGLLFTHDACRLPNPNEVCRWLSVP
jgi:di/tricarboxylate transporter